MPNYRLYIVRLYKKSNPCINGFLWICWMFREKNFSFQFLLYTGYRISLLNTESARYVQLRTISRFPFPIILREFLQFVSKFRPRLNSNDMKFKFKIEYFENCSLGAGTSKNMEVIRDVKRSS